MSSSPSLTDILELPPAPSVPWTPKDVFWGVVSAIVIIILLAVASALVERWGLPLDSSLVVNVGTLMLLIPVWYFTIFKYGTSWADLGLRAFSPATAGMGCGLMIIFFLLNAIYGAILGMFGLQIQPSIAPVFENSSFPIALFFGGAIVAPLIEEIFFRGFIFSGLRNRWDWKRAAATSAVLFALAHILPTSLLPIFILGIIFAFLYQASGSIWPAILMHGLTNSMALSVAYAISQGWIPAA